MTTDINKAIDKINDLDHWIYKVLSPSGEQQLMLNDKIDEIKALLITNPDLPTKGLHGWMHAPR